MPSEQKVKYINITLDKAHRLEKLVNEFFEITRYHFQTGSPVKDKIDLYTLLAQMTDEFFPLLTTQNKRTLLDVPEDTMLLGNPDQLARVFNNVIRNAIAYSPVGSDIRIAATQVNKTVRIVFSNQGYIPPDKLALIFEKFYRLDSSRSSETGGAGIGLAIAREIILSHGGQIWAECEEGMITFTIELESFMK
jgi:two-component system sensor histidine kinase VanS